MIVSKIYDNGFFSMLFFVINHYLYCKKHNINYFLDTKQWLYLYKNGWTDYFLSVNLNFNNTDKNIKVYGHGDIIENVKIQDYKDIIPTIMKYNDELNLYIENMYKKLNLIKGCYSSIYIRRGCKLAYESKIHNSLIYLHLLLKKDPNCNKIFLQTDDYTCYTEILNYINYNKLNIEIITLCT